MHNAVVGVVIVIILLILWGSITTRLLVINLDETNKIYNYHNQTIDDLKRLIDSGDVETSQLLGLVEQLERDFASQATELNTCRSIKEQCGTDLSTCRIETSACTGNLSQCTGNLSQCTTEKGTCTGNLSQCTTEKGTCTGNLSKCTTEKGTCTGNLSQCTTEKGTCTGNLSQCTTEKGTCTGNLSQCTTEKGTCDSDLIIANGKITALEGQPAPTQGESPSPITTTSSKTGQTIGITVAITLVIVGAIWMFIRRASAKLVPATGMRPPDKFGRRTSFLPSGMIRGTRRLFSRSMSGTDSANDQPDWESFESAYIAPTSNAPTYNAPTYNAPTYGNLVPTDSALEHGRDKRAMAAADIQYDIANATAKLTRARSVGRLLEI